MPIDSDVQTYSSMIKYIEGWVKGEVPIQSRQLQSQRRVFPKARMTEKKKEITLARDDFDAVIFDLDGVVTDTAAAHAEAWKRMFDGFLSSRASSEAVPFQPFDLDTDYRVYLDGKLREDGVRSFLQSRGISLPEGQSDDSPGAETVQGLGKLKNSYYLGFLEEHGVDVYSSTVDLIHDLRSRGFKTAIISSSTNCAMILDSAGLSGLFDARVDGIDSEVLGIKGKPAPDIFLEAARRLKVKPGRAVVIEDAISGVQAGRAGDFGLVIGVARKGDREALLQNNADVAVEDLSEIGIGGKL
jgi:beta-phosphoglucomutase family hydrolase